VPIFIFMLKIRYIFTIYKQDYSIISLVYAQTFFDFYVGNYNLLEEDIIEATANLMIVNPNI